MSVGDSFDTLKLAGLRPKAGLNIRLWPRQWYVGWVWGFARRRLAFVSPHKAARKIPCVPGSAIRLPTESSEWRSLLIQNSSYSKTTKSGRHHIVNHDAEAAETSLYYVGIDILSLHRCARITFFRG